MVKDKRKLQEQMHIDTYFNIIDHNLSAIVKDRIDQNDASGKIVKPTDPKKTSLGDFYGMNEGVYRQTLSNMPFKRLIEKDLGMTLIPENNTDQLKYDINFLTIGNRRILAIDGLIESYKKALQMLM